MIISENLYLWAYLNSNIFKWFKKIKFAAFGDADEAGRTRLNLNKMQEVPIKQISGSQLKWFEQKYDQIKKSLGSAGKVKALENELETTLFKLYQFTYEEVKMACPEYWMSEEDYKNFKSEA